IHPVGEPERMTMSLHPECHPKRRLALRSTLRTTRRSVAVIAAALTAATLGAAPAGAQAFQQHKQLTLVIAGSVGSAYNSYGRVLARYMKRHIAGEPDIIVKNMHGAGGDLATEYMNAQA